MPGTYQDPYSEYGRLTSEMWRAIRLVVDTGMHAKGWTEQQAVDYFRANSSNPDGAIKSETAATCHARPGHGLQSRHDQDPAAAQEGAKPNSANSSTSAASTTSC
jgi:hypothetical protein